METSDTHDDRGLGAQLSAPGGDLRTETRQIIALTIPVVITNSSRALMDVTDYLLISWAKLTEAQAAILPAQMLMWSYIVLGMGVVSMVNTFTAQSLGRGEREECSTYAWQTVYVAAFMGLVAFLLQPGIPHLIQLIGHESGVQHAETGYLRVMIHAVAPTIASNGLSWFFVGVRKPWVSTLSVLESNLVNVGVSAALVFGWFGTEPMGIMGAAWGTVIALYYRTIRLAITMWSSFYAHQFATRRMWRPSMKHFMRLVRSGTPFGAQMFFEIAVWAIFVTILVGRTFGTNDLIATNAAWQFMRIAFMPAMGVGQAVTSLVGHSIGAGRLERAIREVRFGVLITTVYMGALSMIYAIWGAELVGWFNPDPEVMRIGRGVMICTAVFQVFDGLAIIYASALRGAGDTFVPSIVFTVFNWVLIVGGGWAMTVLMPGMGSVGPWTAAAVLIIVAAAFFRWRWRGGAWKKIDLFGDRKETLSVVTDGV